MVKVHEAKDARATYTTFLEGAIGFGGIAGTEGIIDKLSELRAAGVKETAIFAGLISAALALYGGKRFRDHRKLMNNFRDELRKKPKLLESLLKEGARAKPKYNHLDMADLAKITMKKELVSPTLLFHFNRRGGATGIAGRIIE
jgi:hypothetical protein